jgi:hypothetical protein
MAMTRRHLLAALALLAIAPGRPATAQSLEPLDLDWEQIFRLTWEVTERRGRPRLLGRIENVSDWGTRRIQLLVERLDPSGRATAQTTAWVPIDLRAGEHTFFDVPVDERAATYRVRVYSFDRRFGGGGG